MYEKGEVAESFKHSIIFPLYKKGDANVVENYRGLSFIDCIGKIFMGLLNDRISNWVNDNKIITEFQAGFRKQYSTVDNIFNLSCMVNLRIAEKNQKLYCFFVDFKAAFDTIDRKALFFKLSCLGASTKMIKVLKDLYSGTTASVWCREGLTESFTTTIGLRQGCICSPNLFSLFVNDLPNFLEGGCKFGKEKINILMYADDVVLIAPTATVLQHMINRLENYCDLWNLCVNLDKSKVMVFRKGANRGRERGGGIKAKKSQL